MPDVVVTVPLSFGLDTWVNEGDPAGEEWSGDEWHFYLGGARPNIKRGERVYVVYNGAIRGYAPLVRIDNDRWRYGLVRHGGAVAVTIPEYVQGFRGFRYRWWDRSVEVPFPEWQNPDAALFERRPHPTKKQKEEEARRWVIDGSAACHPKGFPLPFTEITSAKFVEKNMVVAQVKMFDGLSATLEVTQHNLGGYPSWGFYWRDLPGGAIVCRDEVQWERVEKSPPPVQAERIEQGTLF